MQSYASIRNSTLFYIIVALSLWFLIILFSVVNFLLATKYFTYPDEWIISMIAKCGPEQKLHPNNLMINMAFIKSGLISSVFGAYFGILIDSIYFNGTKINHNDTPFWKGILRLLVGGLAATPLLLPYLLLSANLNMMSLYLLKTTLPFFLAMFILFSVIKPLFIKLRLVNTVKD